MKKLLIAAAMSTGLFAAQAQTAPAKPVTTRPQSATPVATHPAHNCMMADEKVWATFKLNADQTAKVKSIQAVCMKECASKMKTDPALTKLMDKHEAQVKTILTSAQYDSWMKWCSTQVTPVSTVKPVDQK